MFGAHVFVMYVDDALLAYPPPPPSRASENRSNSNASASGAIAVHSIKPPWPWGGGVFFGDIWPVQQRGATRHIGTHRERRIFAQTYNASAHSLTHRTHALTHSLTHARARHAHAYSPMHARTHPCTVTHSLTHRSRDSATLKSRCAGTTRSRRPLLCGSWVHFATCLLYTSPSPRDRG